VRILLLNPNTSTALTERMAEVASRVLAPGTELVTSTASRGFEFLSSRAQAQVAGTVALETIARRIDHIDAVVIAAYGDPGLRAARELFDVPVVGVAEAAMLTACMLGERFSLVTFTAGMAPWYLESVNLSGLASRLASIRIAPAEFRSVMNARGELREALLAEVERAVAEDQADVVILGGAPLAGLAAEIAGAAAVLVDPVEAAVKQAEALACVAPGGASAGSLARPPAKASSGLDPALARWFARDDTSRGTP